MHRTSMGAIVSVSAALVATAALVGAGCSTQTATPADAPTASTLEAATISGNAKGGGNPVSAGDVEALSRVLTGMASGDPLPSTPSTHQPLPTWSGNAVRQAEIYKELV